MANRGSRLRFVAGDRVACWTVLVVGLIGLASGGADWPQWRGPEFNGSTEETGLPTTFSKTDNVLWKAPLPGPAAATPIVWGDRVFVSSSDLAARALVAMCLDRKTGKELWSHKVSEGDRKDPKSNFASSSPVTNGEHVWFFYGNGELLAYTVDGKEVWRRNIQKDHGQFAFLWTFSTSPLLHDGTLYLQVLQRNVPVDGRGRTDGPIESYLLAIDPKSGADKWRQVRASQAREESLEAFTTPVPFTHGGRTEILIAGGDDITGHDPATGRELWRWGTWNPRRIGHWRLVPSPVGGGGVVLACGPKGAPVFAIKAGLNGTLDDSAIAWKSAERELSADVSTPLFYKGRYFILNKERGILFCVDPASGRIHWKGELPGEEIEASPTAADGKIYVLNMDGDAFVVGTGEEFKLLHTVPMGGDDTQIRSSIAIAHSQLFIRTGRTLYCVGQKQVASN